MTERASAEGGANRHLVAGQTGAANSVALPEGGSAAGRFFVGTASWTDPTLIEAATFYPRQARTAEARLKFYAACFSTVEVDSTYYALPAERNARLWAERTPPGFLFNVKAFALLTGHAADTARLPAAMQAMLSADQRREPRLSRPAAPLLDLAFKMFWSALRPLRQSGKLGMLLFQFPPYFVHGEKSLEYLAEVRRRLSDAPIAVEFRHPSWTAEEGRCKATLDFLREHRLAFVSVDAPAGVVPSILERSTTQVYVRFHGRNRENWFRRGGSVAERYKYLYAQDELRPWAAKLKRLSGSERAFVIFNNCYRDYGVTNARMMAAMLAE